MLKHYTPTGHCVSCGRSPPWPHYRICPYCDEYIRMPVWWRVMRVAVPMVCTLATVGVFLLTQPDVAEAQDHLQILSTVKAFLLVVPIVLLLAPCRDSDLIVSSRAGIIIPQIKTFVGGLFIGATVFAVNFCMAFARIVGWEMYLLYALATVGIFLLPFFYRLPFWRVVVTVLLLMSAFIPFHVANFF